MQLRHIHGVDDVDATLDEGAFTPAQHLLAEAHGTGLIGDGELVEDEGIKDTEAMTDLILRQVRQLVVVGVGEIVEITGTNERTEIDRHD